MTRLIAALVLLLGAPLPAMATAYDPGREKPPAEMDVYDERPPSVSADNPARVASNLYTIQDGYVESVLSGSPVFFAYPKIKTVSQSYFKLTGIDLGDDKLIDDFAALHFCSIMQQYYGDEFSWRQAREAIRNFIGRNLEDFPENFVLAGTINLGRYDFGKKAFLLENENALRRTGTFRMKITEQPRCGNYTLQTLPYNFNFRLTNPITLDSIEMPESKAFSLTRRMEQEGNRTRTVYLVFYLRVNDFSTGMSGGVRGGEAAIRSTLLTMRVYYDNERRELLYEYTGE